MDDDALIQDAARAVIGAPRRAQADEYVMALARKVQEIEQEMAQASALQMAANAAVLETLEGIMTMLKRKEDGDG